MGYKSIYVHSSCLCRVPGELTNTYRKCKLPQFPIQCATYLQVIRKIWYRGMVVVAHAWNTIHPQAMDFFWIFFTSTPRCLLINSFETFSWVKCHSLLFLKLPNCDIRNTKNWTPKKIEYNYHTEHIEHDEKYLKHFKMKLLEVKWYKVVPLIYNAHFKCFCPGCSKSVTSFCGSTSFLSPYFCAMVL